MSGFGFGSEDEELLQELRRWLLETSDELDRLPGSQPARPASAGDATEHSPEESQLVVVAVEHAKLLSGAVAEMAPEGSGPPTITLATIPLTSDLSQFGSSGPGCIVNEFMDAKVLASAEQVVAARDRDQRASTVVRLDSEIDPDSPLPEVGLRELVEAITALRHESKLQTKSTRGLDCELRVAIGALEAAVRQIQTMPVREQEAGERAARPLVDTLIGLDESLIRAARACAAAHRRIAWTTTERPLAHLSRRLEQLPAWRRWLLGPWYGELRQRCAQFQVTSAESEFASIVEGMELIRSRLERTLLDRGIERLETVGRLVDPAQMSVVELVDDADVAPETVVEEVRPGYTWNGRVIRFAEVRAAKIANRSDVPSGRSSRGAVSAG